MTLKFISYKSHPNYLASSSDIVDNTISGLGIVGATVFVIDTAQWYVVETDLSLSPYSNVFGFRPIIGRNISIASGDITEIESGELKDNGISEDVSIGVSGVPVSSADMTSPAAVTDIPTIGSYIHIIDIVISADKDMSVVLSEETTGLVVAKVFVAAYGTMKITPRGKMQLSTANKRLFATASVAGNISIQAIYSKAGQAQYLWFLSGGSRSPGVVGLWTSDGIWSSTSTWYGG